MDASNSFPFLLLWDADSAVIVISCQVTKRFIIVKLYLTEFLSRKGVKRQVSEAREGPKSQ